VAAVPLEDPYQMLRITRERLREMLVQAYESGWSGCLELKDEYADLVLDGVTDAGEGSGTSSLTISASDNDLFSQHYSYYGYDVSGSTVLVNDPEEEI